MSVKDLTVALNEKRLPVFVAVVLDEASHRKLLSWWETATGSPVLKQTFAHHMTIKFKPSTADMEKHEVGRKVSLTVTGWASNGKVQAVVVDGYESANAVPHVTVATDGTPPKFSNDLVSAGYTRVRGPVLHGEIRGQSSSKG